MLHTLLDTALSKTFTPMLLKSQSCKKQKFESAYRKGATDCIMHYYHDDRSETFSWGCSSSSSTFTSLPHRPTWARLSAGPSPCCRCWGTGWYRAFWCDRHTSWFPPSWAGIPVTADPWLEVGADWLLLSSFLSVFSLFLSPSRS